MESGAFWGWVGGVTGCAVGFLGGAIGTYCSIRNTSGPRERAFVIKASILCWVFVLAFLAGMLLIPTWHRHLLWAPYALLLIVGIQMWNKKQSQIRQEESGTAGPGT